MALTELLQEKMYNVDEDIFDISPIRHIARMVGLRQGDYDKVTGFIRNLINKYTAGEQLDINTLSTEELTSLKSVLSGLLAVKSGMHFPQTQRYRE